MKVAYVLYIVNKDDFTCEFPAKLRYPLRAVTEFACHTEHLLPA